LVRLRPSDYEVLALMAGMERRRLDDQAATIIECVVRYLKERDPVFSAAWQAFERGEGIPPPPAGYAAFSQDALAAVLREAREQ
jgi:hypothetical protein